MTSSMHPLVTEFERRLDAIRAATGCRRLLVALSGGLDSTVLLALAARVCPGRGLALAALHIDHGLQHASAAWARQCVLAADALGVECTVVRLATGPRPGDSVEDWARGARYAAIEMRLDAETCVLTAHHADDQMETVVQRMLSGAGPHGLSAIRPVRRLGAGFLARPLLGCRRSALSGFATEAGLTWIEDPSNRDTRYTRNHLRSAVMPLLESVAPGSAANLARVAELQQEVAGLLDSLCDEVLDRAGLPPQQLATAGVLAADRRLRPYLIKRWLARADAPRPGHRQLHELLHGVLEAREDAAPLLAFGGVEIRRYRGIAHLMRPRQRGVPREPIAWSPETVLALPWGQLRLVQSQVGGLDASRIHAGALSVRFRAGGERCHPVTRRHAQDLKKLFQEWGVPPWERATVPLLYCDDELAAVGELCICVPFAVPPGVPAYVLAWTPGSVPGPTAGP